MYHTAQCLIGDVTATWNSAPKLSLKHAQLCFTLTGTRSYSCKIIRTNLSSVSTTCCRKFGKNSYPDISSMLSNAWCAASLQPKSFILTLLLHRNASVWYVPTFLGTPFTKQCQHDRLDQVGHSELLLWRVCWAGSQVQNGLQPPCQPAKPEQKVLSNVEQCWAAYTERRMWNKPLAFSGNVASKDATELKRTREMRGTCHGGKKTQVFWRSQGLRGSKVGPHLLTLQQDATCESQSPQVWPRQSNENKLQESSMMEMVNRYSGSPRDQLFSTGAFQKLLGWPPVWTSKFWRNTAKES